jgi:hypothetical protein
LFFRTSLQSPFGLKSPELALVIKPWDALPPVHARGHRGDGGSDNQGVSGGLPSVDVYRRTQRSRHSTHAAHHHFQFDLSLLNYSGR